jgi:hypothetical protein
MTYKNLLTFSSVLGLAFGLGFAFFPGQLVGMYGGTLNEAGLYVGQLFGAAFITLGLLNWFLRDLGDNSARQGIMLANMIGDVIGFIFALMAQLGGVSTMNSLGWSSVVLYLILALGFAYLRFMAK